MLPVANPLPVGVAVMVNEPVFVPNVPVALDPLPETLMIEVSLLLQVAEVEAVKLTEVVLLLLTVLLLHPEVQVTVLAACPTVTEMLPLIVLFTVAEIVIALVVLPTSAVIAPLLSVLLTVILVGSPELQSAVPVKTFVLPSS